MIGVCGTAMGSLAGQLVALGHDVRAAMRCLPSNVYKVGGVGVRTLEGFDAKHSTPSLT